MENTKLVNILTSNGFTPFNNTSDYGSALSRAQYALGNKTHYLDKDTLRFFKARVNSCSVIADGLFLKIVESVPQNFDGSNRGTRVVLFDMDGEVVYRPDLEKMRKTGEAANSDFKEWFSDFNATEYYLKRVQAKKAMAEKQAISLEKASLALCTEEFTA